MWVSRRTDYATRALLALSLDGGEAPLDDRGAEPPHPGAAAGCSSRSSP